MLNASQVKHLADLADSWLGGGRDVKGNVDVFAKVLSQLDPPFLSPMFN